MADTLSSSRHAAILLRIIADKLDPVAPATNPRLFMLGGQPGAGKSGIRQAIVGNPKVGPSITIDPDDLRTYHPQYVAFVRENPDTAAGRVHPDAAKWAAELRAKAIAKRVNIIFDGTLGGNPAASTGMAKEAAKAGFQVEVHVVAVPLEVSQQGVRGRYENAIVAYEQDPVANAPPRNVPDGIQKGSYTKIPDVLEALAKTGVVSRMRVADRSGKKLDDVSGRGTVKKGGGKSASKALKQERSRAWTPKEIDAFDRNGLNIEALLQNRIDAAEGQEKERLTGELQRLKGRREAAVNAKNSVLRSLRPERDEWIRKNTGFRVPPAL